MWNWTEQEEYSSYIVNFVNREGKIFIQEQVEDYNDVIKLLDTNMLGRDDVTEVLVYGVYRGEEELLLAENVDQIDWAAEAEAAVEVLDG